MEIRVPNSLIPLTLSAQKVLRCDNFKRMFKNIANFHKNQFLRPRWGKKQTVFAASFHFLYNRLVKLLLDKVKLLLDKVVSLRDLRGVRTLCSDLKQLLNILTAVVRLEYNICIEQYNIICSKLCIFLIYHHNICYFVCRPLIE